MRHLYADAIHANTYSFSQEKKDTIALLMIGSDTESGATYFGTSDTTTAPATALKAIKAILVSTLNSGYTGAVTLYTTNTYTVKVFTSWLKGWLKQGGVETTWLTSKKEPVANQETIKEILVLSERFESFTITAIDQNLPLVTSTIQNVATLRSNGAGENLSPTVSFHSIGNQAVAPAVVPVASPAHSVSTTGAQPVAVAPVAETRAPVMAECAPKSTIEASVAVAPVAQTTYPGASEALSLALATIAALTPTSSTFTLADGVTITISK